MQAALPGPSTFSLSWAGFIEEPERKYCFECDSEEQCREWIEALKRARWAELLMWALSSALCAVCFRGSACGEPGEESGCLFPSKLPCSSK